MYGIREFDIFGPCEKCGAGTIGTFPRNTVRWCDSGASPECGAFFWFSKVLRFNHFHRVCGRCHFEWYEAPTDIDYSPDESDELFEQELAQLEAMSEKAEEDGNIPVLTGTASPYGEEASRVQGYRLAGSSGFDEGLHAGRQDSSDIDFGREAEDLA